MQLLGFHSVNVNVSDHRDKDFTIPILVSDKVSRKRGEKKIALSVSF